MKNSFILFMILFILNCDSQSSTVSLHLSRSNAITNAIKNNSSSVVGINVITLDQKSYNHNKFWNNFFPYSLENNKIRSFGSGTIVSSDGYIITNAHVVDKSEEIIVTLEGGQRHLAKLVGIDRPTDIALLKIQDKNLPYFSIGDSDSIIVGEWVVAMGNPLALFDISNKPTATAGIVSGVGIDFGLRKSGQVYQNMIQTDASINQGNSGGPLINSHGELIGINTFIMTGQSGYNEGSVGIGFAIPSNLVYKVVEELKKNGKINRNYNTGLKVQKLDGVLAKYLRVKARGVLIQDVEFNSAGEEAGLKVGDVIVTVDSKEVESPQDIIRVISEGLHQVGDYIDLVIIRNNLNKSIKLKLEEPKSKYWGF